PVHLNLAFREPLVADHAGAQPGRPGDAPWHRPAPGRASPPASAVQELAAGGKGLIVAGAGAGDPAAVHQLASALGWPVLADPRSGCRLPLPTTVAAADALLRVDAFAAGQRPELVLRLGAPWASRVVAEWLAGLDVPQWLVDPAGTWIDPARTATTVVAADPTLVCLAVAGADARPAPPSWLEGWRWAEAAAQLAFDRALEGREGPTEPGVARSVAAAVPEGSTIVVSSSMPVRDLEWYARPRTGLRVLSNRGANGIDGVTSTALGVAAAGHGPTAAILGDLAFLHDTNGLLVPRGAAEELRCTLVVVDNDGGGIFSFLPQATQVSPERFERLLGTPQGVDLPALAGVHGIPATTASTAADVAPEVGASLAAGGVRLVHVRTDRHRNVAVHDELHAAVAAALTGSGPDDGGQQGL
ncbi:MAG: 2-succinyl-5-enolpyruvyl-6-hydroxy-3-cyclohexene-1-carboxylate synthase, partial [Actinomycetota bacterium]|nr:2-succinyl-5-enolpyruvyl-6-hydroxy-3-cyclohexene-1-carboxylate synthase [Actinomycetota bacterium]